MDIHFNLLLNVIQSDSEDSTRQISLDVNTPEEIDGIINFSDDYLKKLSLLIYNFIKKGNINPTITYGKVLNLKGLSKKNKNF